MSYRNLYAHCQQLTPKISTKEIKRVVLEITGKTQLDVIINSPDPRKLRGYFLSSERTSDDRFPKLLGKNVVVLARGMNDCWNRFILTKEMMHLFDTPNEETSTPEQFKTLLQEFEPANPIKASSPQYASESKGFWMALACLCPEANRLEFIEQYEKSQINYYGIALKLRIPEQLVPVLFKEDYSQIINWVMR
jgi:hypothetical protein